MQGLPSPFLATFVCLGEREASPREPAARRVDSQHSPRHSKQAAARDRRWLAARERARKSRPPFPTKQETKSRTGTNFFRWSARPPAPTAQAQICCVACWQRSVCSLAAASSNDRGARQAAGEFVSASSPRSPAVNYKVSISPPPRHQPRQSSTRGSLARHTHAALPRKIKKNTQSRRHRRPPGRAARMRSSRESSRERAHTRTVMRGSRLSLPRHRAAARPPRLPSIYQRPCQ